MINQQSTEYSDEHNVAVLGPTGSGKTVFITLLNHVMANYFLNTHNDLQAIVKEGIPFLEACENGIRNGEFPERTQQLSRDRIVLTMSGTGSTSQSIDISFPDISGEDYDRLCLSDEINGAERTLQALTMGKGKGLISPMGYVVFAKMYVILLDCSKISDWPNMQTRFAQALTSIRDFKIEIQNSRNRKINVPIAIILTKSDCLPDRGVDLKSIVREKMPRFYHTLSAICDGKVGYFKVFVDVKRNSDNKTDVSEGLKVAQPLSYSHEDYTCFLSWLHRNILE